MHSTPNAGARAIAAAWPDNTEGLQRAAVVCACAVEDLIFTDCTAEHAWQLHYPLQLAAECFAAVIEGFPHASPDECVQAMEQAHRDLRASGGEDPDDYYGLNVLAEETFDDLIDAVNAFLRQFRSDPTKTPLMALSRIHEALLIQALEG